MTTTAAAPGAVIPPLGAIAERFLAELEHGRRFSALTVRAYRSDLERLRRALPSISLEACTIDDVRRVLARLHASGLGPRSLARVLSAWRSFFAYCTKAGAVSSNPCSGVRAPRAPRSLPKSLSPDAAAGLFERRPKDALECRDVALLELLYSSGLRLAEVCSLDVRAAESAVREGCIVVTGKGRKTRSIPVGQPAAAALKAWLAARGGLARGAGEALFITARGRRLAPRSVQVRLRRWALLSQAAQGLHPHMLRHSFASHVLQSSGDLRAVQEMLGHASIATTQIYTALDFQHLARVYDEAHPRARKK